MQRVLVATASAESSRWLAPRVIQLASNLNAEIIALHVRSNFESIEEADSAVDIFAIEGSMAGIDVTTVIGKGDVISEIAKHAELPDTAMVVLGASVKLDVAEWVSSKVTELTQTPVLVLPRIDFDHDADEPQKKSSAERVS